MRELEPVVLALTSDESYFPGLYCAVASALSAMDPARKVDVKVLDGGLSQASRDTLTSLVERIGHGLRAIPRPASPTGNPGGDRGHARRVPVDSPGARRPGEDRARAACHPESDRTAPSAVGSGWLASGAVLGLSERPPQG